MGGSGIGEGQTWQNLTASRTCNTMYINDTGKAISLTVFATGSGGGIYAVIGGTSINIASGYSAFTNMTGSIIVPKTSSYIISCAQLSYITYWYELR